MEAERRPAFSVWELCVMALLTAILFLQEELLNFLPNVQLTVFLILLYAKCLGFWKTMMIVTAYLLLDAAFMGSLNPVFTTGQWIGWMLNPLITCTCLRKTENSVALAGAAAGFALLYCWVMILPTMWMLHVDFVPYMLSDIPFELILAASSFLSTLLLYDPLRKLLPKLLGRM